MILRHILLLPRDRNEDRRNLDHGQARDATFAGRWSQSDEKVQEWSPTRSELILCL